MRNSLVGLLMVLTACQVPYDTVPPSGPLPDAGFNVLVFTKVAGFRHASIETGSVALEDVGARRGWGIYVTENGAVFDATRLSAFSVVVWLNTTGDVLNRAQEAAFQAFVETGGGYVGIHAAADTEHEWTWYGTLLGARFRNHPNFPNVREAVVAVEDAGHPAMAFLPARWTWRDEWYNFDTNPRTVPGVRVLATVDEATYTGGTMGDDHPIVWCAERGRGRMFYTALGHPSASFADSSFVRHVEEAIAWAGRLAPSRETGGL